MIGSKIQYKFLRRKQGYILFIKSTLTPNNNTVYFHCLHPFTGFTDTIVLLYV